MRKKLVNLCLFCFLVVFSGKSQSEVDYYRFATTSIMSSPRVMGMSGSFGALGANGASASINPAGLGRYSRGDFETAFFYENQADRSTFQGTTLKSQGSKTNIGYINWVNCRDVSNVNKSGFLYRQISFGYNKLGSYTNTMKYSGVLPNSLLEGFASNAAGIPELELPNLAPFTSNIAYQAYLINPVIAGNSIYYDPYLSNSDMFHTRTVKETGFTGEYFGSYSVNFRRQLFLGGTVAYRRVKYLSETEHEERVIDTTGFDLDKFVYNETNSVTGGGFLARLGAIYDFQNNLSIGVAYQTSTRLRLNDKFSTDITGYFYNGPITEVPADQKPSSTLTYRVVQPSKLTFSASYVDRNRGCLNVDFGIQNYNQGKMLRVNESGYDFKFENKTISEIMQTAAFLNVGIELIVSNISIIRGGYHFQNSGFKSSQLRPSSTSGFSLGYGYRKGNFKFDLAYTNSFGKYPYSAFPESRTDVKFIRHQIFLGISVVLPTK